MSKLAAIKGSIPPVVTPIRDGAVDYDAYAGLIEFQVSEGSHGVLVNGTTAEPSTLTTEERNRLVDIAIETVNGRVPVVAATGSQSLAETEQLTAHAAKAGADALLVVTPYYNKPTQSGLIAHFSAIAKASKLPIIIYNIPSRSVIDMSVETMAYLHQTYPSIIGVKDSSCQLERVTQQKLSCGDNFVQLTGEDGTALAHAAHGGVGAISVTANVAPQLCAEFQNTLATGDFASARAQHEKLMPMHIALFLEPGVAGAKYALSKLGRAKNILRSPILPVSADTESAIDDAMRHAGLIN